MKPSVSVSAEDVALLDEYARASGLRSRSAALQHAIRLLRHADLEQDSQGDPVLRLRALAAAERISASDLGPAPE